MICDRCKVPITHSGNPDQPLCDRCLNHLRVGGGWELGSPTPEPARSRLWCPLDLLPLRAHILYGEVPLYPIESDFHMAATDVAHAEEDAAAHWRIEAIRYRTQHRGAVFDDHVLAILAGRVAARLWRVAARRLADAEAMGSAA